VREIEAALRAKNLRALLALKQQSHEAALRAKNLRALLALNIKKGVLDSSRHPFLLAISNSEYAYSLFRK